MAQDTHRDSNTVPLEFGDKRVGGKIGSHLQRNTRKNCFVMSELIHCDSY